jgi:CheY-like chemotaxis protein
MRVIVVDDHPEVRTSIANLARRWGHEVETASLVDSFQPDCAVVDLMMPGMDGMELARRLRQRFSSAQLALIAISGFSGPDIRDGCLAAGFDAFLIKPGEIAELRRLIGRDRPENLP